MFRDFRKLQEVDSEDYSPATYGIVESGDLLSSEVNKCMNVLNSIDYTVNQFPAPMQISKQLSVSLFRDLHCCLH